MVIPVLGHQANLKESSESKELAEMRLQVLVVVITSDSCESKKEIMRQRVIYKVRITSILLSLDQSHDNIKTIIILSLDNIKIISFSPY